MSCQIISTELVQLVVCFTASRSNIFHSDMNKKSKTKIYDFFSFTEI